MGKMHFYQIMEKIGPYYSWLVLIYLVCFTFMLVSEYKSNTEFADSLICEEKMGYVEIEQNHTFDINASNIKNCSFIKEMNRKGNNLLYWALVYFFAVFFFEIIWPNRKEILHWFEDLEKKDKD